MHARLLWPTTHQWFAGTWLWVYTVWLTCKSDEKSASGMSRLDGGLTGWKAAKSKVCCKPCWMVKGFGIIADMALALFTACSSFFGCCRELSVLPRAEPLVGHDSLSPVAFTQQVAAGSTFCVPMSPWCSPSGGSLACGGVRRRLRVFVSEVGYPLSVIQSAIVATTNLSCWSSETRLSRTCPLVMSSFSLGYRSIDCVVPSQSPCWAFCFIAGCSVFTPVVLTWV